MIARGSGFVVAGGTGALGHAVVGALLAEGARVAVPYRSQERWQRLRASFESPDIWGARAEVAEPAQAEAFLGEAVRWLGSLAGVAIVSGAYAGSGTFEAAPLEEWESMMAANLTATSSVCRAALPHLLSGGGSVVTMASRLAQSGGAGAAAYAVSKAAVVALTRVLALENETRGVRFNCVLPSIIDTSDNRRAMPGADTSSWTPPEAIARVILFLLSSDSAPMTGSALPVEGVTGTEARR
jgi:NAD(P)-dependent dehydrogenase (short-subunit alcohol dehydrogenase family)